MLERINLVPKRTSTGNVWKVAYASVAMFFVLSFCAIYMMRQNAMIKIADIETKMNAFSQYQSSSASIEKAMGELAVSVNQKRAILTKLSADSKEIKEAGGNKYMYSFALRFIAMELPKTVRCKDISFNKGTGSIVGESLSYEELP